MLRRFRHIDLICWDRLSFRLSQWDEIDIFKLESKINKRNQSDYSFKISV